LGTYIMSAEDVVFNSSRNDSEYSSARFNPAILSHFGSHIYLYLQGN